MDTNEETNQTAEFDFGSIMQGFRDAAGEPDAASGTVGELPELNQVIEALKAAEMSPEEPAPYEEPTMIFAPAAPEAETIRFAPEEEPTAAFEAPPVPETKPDVNTSELTGLLQGLLDQAEVPTQDAPAAEPVQSEEAPDPMPEFRPEPRPAAEPTLRRPAVQAAPAAPRQKTQSDSRQSGPIPLLRSEKLRELKRKLVAGPEKRYYELSEQGIGRLQLGILLNTVILATAVILIVLNPSGNSAGPTKLLVFSQVFLMLLSGLVGCQAMIDGLIDLLRLKYSVNSTLCLSFLACICDAWFCLDQKRMPCCSGFVLAMEAALFARYQRRSAEMSQMDTLRKASRLIGIVREPGVIGKRAAIVRTDGDVEDFMDIYNRVSGPELVQRIFAAVALVMCIGIAVLTGMLHHTSLAFQIFASAMLVSVPACSYFAVSRPHAILAKRLHMVGSVICGWSGVKKLSARSTFVLDDRDFLPRGSTKLNGIKFCSERTPAEVVSYSASLVYEAGGNLVPVFRSLMNGRNGVEYPVDDYRDYGAGGIGGIVNGEAVLVGSVEFMEQMRISVPEDARIDQAVYVAIDNELTAVVGVSYARMRSVTAGLVSLGSRRRLRSVAAVGDFNLTESFLRSKFNIRTRRMSFPDAEESARLRNLQASSDAQVLAMTSKEDLISAVYPVTGSMALHSACRAATLFGILGGIAGLIIMAVMGYRGSTEYLTPENLLLYQLLWLLPGFLATEWTRRV